jgi:hypothetical protein
MIVACEPGLVWGQVQAFRGGSGSFRAFPSSGIKAHRPAHADFLRGLDDTRRAAACQDRADTANGP